jgi:uncharacterized protein (DUF1800 family)
VAAIDEVRRVGITDWIRAQKVAPMTLFLATVRDDAAVFRIRTKLPTVRRFPALISTTHNVAWWKLAPTAPDQFRQRVAFALSQIFVMAGEEAHRAEPFAQFYDVLAEEAFGIWTLLERVTLHPETALGRYRRSRGPVGPTR